MKRFLALAVSLLSGMTLSAAAQTAPAATPAKVAVISFQEAVAQTNEGLRSITDLQSKFAPKRDQLKVRSAELDSLAKQLQAQGATLSQQEVAKRTREIEDKKKIFDRDAQDAQSDLQSQMHDLFTSLAPKFYDVMVSYAQQHGFTLVLDGSQEQTPVLYAGTSTNITKAVIEAYNAKSGVPAPAAQPGAAARPAAKPASPAAR